MIDATLDGARVMTPDGWQQVPLPLAGGRVAKAPTGRRIDLRGYDLLPGIVDAHGDGFERHMAPRRGALRERAAGVVACAAELAASGITTAALAQFWSWEGGMRGPDFAEEVFASVAEVAPTVPVDLRLQLRLETHYLESFERAETAIDRWGIDYVVFNDHLPHARLAEGRRPPRLTGQALKSGRNPEAHLALMQRLHAEGAAVPGALDALCAGLGARGVIMGSHDDRTPEARAAWRDRGVRVSEFPETLEAARASGVRSSWLPMITPRAPSPAQSASSAPGTAAPSACRRCISARCASGLRPDFSACPVRRGGARGARRALRRAGRARRDHGKPRRPHARGARRLARSGRARLGVSRNARGG
ncbi:alpha-D-ribose 1-methylphosphonate 5-triphosphate diphosphatase, partial [Salipiger mucosus]|uniref:alpha-D-ribose 1-methylphosphonate 5-triphosphate diphosphatase n=1 Tax=Salipiger mucosus TaxID=263378 RepID=UPI0012EB3A93